MKLKSLWGACFVFYAVQGFAGGATSAPPVGCFDAALNYYMAYESSTLAGTSPKTVNSTVTRPPPVGGGCINTNSSMVACGPVIEAARKLCKNDPNNLAPAQCFYVALNTNPLVNTAADAAALCQDVRTPQQAQSVIQCSWQYCEVWVPDPYPWYPSGGYYGYYDDTYYTYYVDPWGYPVQEPDYFPPNSPSYIPPDWGAGSAGGGSYWGGGGGSAGGGDSWGGGGSAGGDELKKANAVGASYITMYQQCYRTSAGNLPSVIGAALAALCLVALAL